MFTQERRLKKQVLLLITLIVVLVASARLYIDIVHNKEVFDSKVKTTVNQIQTFVSLEKRKIYDFYTSRAAYITKNRAVFEAIKNRDRKKLYGLVVKNFNILKEENKFFTLMHFHLPNGDSFLRMHKPEMYGDNLLEARPMICNVHDNHEITDGFAVGKLYHDSEALQYRVAYPIYDVDNTYLGALEFGVASSEIILATMDILHYTHEDNKNDIQIAFLHSNDMLVHKKGEEHLYRVGPYNLAHHSDFFEYLLEEKLDFSKNSSIVKKDSRTYLLQWNQVLLKNYDNEIEGTVLVSFDITEDEKVYYKSLFKAILAPLTVLIVMLVFFNWAFGYFMKKLMSSHKELEVQHEFNQNLLDLQDNIIITTDGLHILSVNRAFLTFFNMNSLSKFKKEYDCICNFFIENENFFSLALLKGDENWIDHMLNESQEYKNVVSMISYEYGEPRAFSVKINELNTENHHYIITFTDITGISIKSKEFEYRASHDALTKIYNRLKLNEIFSKEMSLVNRYENPLSIIMFDIDYFKVVNDTHGHIAGDRVLVELSKYVSRAIRITDIFARWGGEEFMIVLPQTSIDDAHLMAQKLCDSIFSELTFGDLKQISCSFGVTQCKKDDTEDEVFKRVDDALYQAKDSGRNCVVSIS